MNLFDKIKDAFSNEDEKAAEAAKQAEEQAAAEATAAAAAEQEEATRLADEAARAAAIDVEEKAVQDALAAASAQTAAEEAARQAEAQAAEAAAAAAAVDARPQVSLGHVLEMINHDADPNVPTGNALDTGVGLLVENALAQVIDYSGPIDGALGTSFIRAYSRFQESLGYSGGDADGYPGTESLTVLGERTGAFRVVG